MRIPPLLNISHKRACFVVARQTNVRLLAEGLMSSYCRMAAPRVSVCCIVADSVPPLISLDPLRVAQVWSPHWRSLFSSPCPAHLPTLPSSTSPLFFASVSTAASAGSCERRYKRAEGNPVGRRRPARQCRYGERQATALVSSAGHGAWAAGKAVPKTV